MRAARSLLLAAAMTLVMVLPAAAQAQAPACPCTVFAPTDAPSGDALVDQPVEVGMKFRSDEDGFITALRFYKQSNNTGTHVGHLWTSAGQQLAEIQFTGETASGWQEAALPVAVPITRDTTYITSYHSSQGRFGFTPGYFFSGIDRAPLHAPSDALAAGNGVYRYGASGFPDSTFNATNYWVDAVFTRLPPGDSRAPEVSDVSPAAGASGAAVDAKVTATFDEPLDALTVNAGTFTLADSTGAAVAAQVTYDAGARKATLTPTAPLALGKTYTATVKGGPTGVSDTAGNRLAADRTWSFSTSPECPCTVFGADAPSGDAVADQPVEVGMKFRSDEDGFITALRFYKQSNNTGTHVGHLWTAGGQLLASATYTGETASGWQEVNLPNPVAITRDTTYVTSYYASGGRYGFSPGFFNQGVDRAPLHAPSAASAGGNGVFHYGESAFPDQTFNATNYWVDAAFHRAIPPDTRGPTITNLSPQAGASDVDATTDVTASFDEPLAPASISGATFTLRDEDGILVAADVTYDAQAQVAKLQPQTPLANSETYLARLKGGPTGVTDSAGNGLTADRTWTFTTEAQSPGVGPGGPIQVITDPGDRFGRYYAEILRAEGLNEFDVTDGPVTAQKLAGHDVVLLASAAVSDAEVALLTSWVQNGGNLIAMRPDKKLAGLLGLTDSGGTRANQYLKADPGAYVSAGIEAQTLQYHGTADRYALNGAGAVAGLYSNATTATTEPAVSLRNVGSGGGQAAAFTFDLARSVVYTRQGNPAWAGQKRDGTPNGIRPVDLFYGAKAGDVQPDWVDMSKIDVPQADEQQRLLANLITEMNRDKAPLPRFWYLPRGEKAAVVDTGDDHARGGTPAFFDRLQASSEPGCSVADWECVRATSYLYPDSAMTDAQAAAYEAAGFEVALHLVTGSGCQDFTPASLDADLTSQLARFAASWPSAGSPATNRTHCIVWSDWATQPKLEKAHGIRFDTNYYYNSAPGWLTKPGLLTGSGFPQRFADLDGSLIDVYQAMTQVTDESEMPMPGQVDTLLDNALGPKAWYGVVTVNNHTDNGDHANANNIVASAQERGVPVVSSAQMLDWLDGRNASSFADVAYSAGRLTFSVVTNPKARGLEAMLPAQSASGPLSGLTRAGQAVSRETRTVKGVDYVVFKATAGDYTATYATDAGAPSITGVNAVADADGHATVTWQTDEPADSRVDYGTTAALGSQTSDSARVTEHSIELTGLGPDTAYRFRVSSVDAAGNSASSPATSQAPGTFQTPPGALVDNRASEFGAGTHSSTYSGQTLTGSDGEVQLQPTVREEFEGTGVPAGWSVRSWGPGGEAGATGGSLVADGASTYTTPIYEGARVIEFVGTFRPVNDQAAGFGDDLSDFPYAIFGTGNSGMPFGVYAQSSGGPGTDRTTALPGVSLNAPHRFRIEWNAANVLFYVDGALAATHTVTIDRPMRPAVSDYGLFGAGVQVHWLRQGSYANAGTFSSRILDGGPQGAEWQTLAAQASLASGTQIAYDTRSGSTAQPDGSWSAWQAVGAGGAIASPTSRYLQYRARMGSTSGMSSPTLNRVDVSFGPGPGPDGQPPSAPGSLTATAQNGAAQLSWGAANDNVGVTEYRVHRSATSGFAPSAENRVATVPSGTTYTDSGLASGTYHYRVVAADAAGNAGPPSAQASATVTSDSTAPNVSVTAPAANALLAGTVSLTATASDNVGVQSVEFRVDGVAVGSALTTSPYSLALNTTTFSNGTHTLSAVARDAAGNSGTSANVTVTVDNAAPTAPGSPTATGGVNVAQLNWTASTDNRGVTEYRVHRATTSGFTPSAANRVATVASGTSYSDTGLAPGTYYYRVIAADAAGNAGPASTQVSAVVTSDATAPNVAVSAPAAGSRVAGTISVTATATDNVGVQSVQFRVDGANVGAADTSNPYSLSLNTTTLSNGAHTLSAVARDAAGNTRTSANVSVTVDNSLPTVALTAPAGGALVAGTISVAATASDNAGVQSVQFKVDGADVGSADTTSPYSLSLNTTTLSNGAHTLTAVARDTAGNTRTSSGVAVTVDNQLPTVAITAPASGARISGTTTVTAGATDNVAVQSVEFRVDGAAVASDSSAPYTMTGETSWLTDGSHTLSAVARDTAGNTRTSANVAVTVDNNAPTVSISAPAAGATVSGTATVTASAADTVGVQSVQFRVDGADVGAADTSSPYSLAWNTTTLADGDHTLSAVARDATGNTRTSANVTVSVDNKGLVAAFGFDETSGSTVTDEARDHDGTISGATRTADGRFGRALTFDGVNDWVTVPNDTDFNLTAGMTLEAWVRPSVLGTTWRTVVMKERASALAYALFANNNTSDPTARVFTSSDLATSGTTQLALNTWTHLAMTWGSSTLRLYVNGAQVATRTAAGTLTTGTGPLRIGGNSFSSQWFNGRIDELRVYRRALSASEIAADMNRAAP